MALQKSDVESFLTAERPRREQRPAARERFRDTDSARLADDHIRRAQVDVHAISPLAHAQALGMLARESVERVTRIAVATRHRDEPRAILAFEQCADCSVDAQAEPAAEHEDDRPGLRQLQFLPRVALRQRPRELRHQRHTGRDLRACANSGPMLPRLDSCATQ